MKRLLVLLVTVVVAGKSFGSLPAESARTISNISSIPQRVLQRSISPKFYRSLLISPVEGYVAVRGQLDGTRLSGLRVVHSERNGEYDLLALERARAVTIAGYYGLDKLNKGGSVVVHLLIYKIADGTMALSFANLDEPGGDQQQYYGSAVLAVLKSDGRWTEIKSVPTLHGKGIAVQTTRSSKFATREIYFFAGFGTRGR
jgi:hypothetical protein